MHCGWLLIKCIQFDILVILLSLKYGTANYMGSRSRERSVNNSNGGKSEDSSHVVNSGSVRAVGEVFVPKTFSLNSQEPTCEELRAMWIFSKRQSRAAEITNEIPTYRDPFTYNVWEPLYLNSRLLGSIRMSAKERTRSPVFGRVVSREPTVPQRMPFEHRAIVELGSGSHGLSQPRFYGSEMRPQPGVPSSSRRSSKNRYMGLPNGAGNTGKENQNAVAIQGSFQKLKELIWTERARELTQQRREEEIAARAAALKEIANGKNIQSPFYPQSVISSDSVLMDENRSPDANNYQHSEGSSFTPLNGQNLQSDKTNKNIHRAGLRASSRNMGNSPPLNFDARQDLKAIFSGNYNIDHSNRQSRIQIPATALFSNDWTEREHAGFGIPRTYPMRKSHFRERNRSLLKEPQINDHFRRTVRGVFNAQSKQENKIKALYSEGTDVIRQLEGFGQTSIPNYKQSRWIIDQIPDNQEFEVEFSEYATY